VDREDKRLWAGAILPLRPEAVVAVVAAVVAAVAAVAAAS